MAYVFYMEVKKKWKTKQNKNKNKQTKSKTKQNKYKLVFEDTNFSHRPNWLYHNFKTAIGWNIKMYSCRVV